VTNIVVALLKLIDINEDMPHLLDSYLRQNVHTPEQGEVVPQLCSNA